MKNYKEWIPNALTAYRIIITPIIIVLGIMNQMVLVIVLTALAAFSDFLDGRLARTWGTTSSKGAKLDAVADKILAIGLTTCLAIHFSLLWIPVILECILGGCNLFFHYKSGKTESLWIGKVKTWFLFFAILIVMVTYFVSSLTSIMNGFILITVNLQILSLIAYCFNFYDNMHPITVEDNSMHQQIMDETEKTMIIHDLDTFIEQFQEQETDIN